MCASTVLRGLCSWCCSGLTIVSYYNSQIKDGEKVRLKRNLITCPKSHSQCMLKPKSESRMLSVSFLSHPPLPPSAAGKTKAHNWGADYVIPGALPETLCSEWLMSLQFPRSRVLTHTWQWHYVMFQHSWLLRASQKSQCTCQNTKDSHCTSVRHISYT